MYRNKEDVDGRAQASEATPFFERLLPGRDERESGVWDERLGRSAHRARDGKAACNTARTDRGGREADRLESRPRCTARDGASEDQGAADRLHDGKVAAGERRHRLEAAQVIAGEFAVESDICSNYRWLLTYQIESGLRPEAMKSAEDMFEWSATHDFLSAGAEDILAAVAKLRESGLKVDVSRVPRLRAVLAESQGGMAVTDGAGPDRD